MTKNGNLTITDIAKACGVGLGTVSRTINGKPGVKEEVRKKILSYVHEIGWRSNSIAGKLNSARKGKLVIFLSSLFGLIDRMNDNDVMGLLADACANEGYETLLLTGNRSECLEQCMQLHPHALVQFGSFGSVDRTGEIEGKLLEAGIRLITIGESEECRGAMLHPDHTDAGRRQAQLLRRNGHRKIGVVCCIGEQKTIHSIDDMPTIRLRRYLQGIQSVHPELKLERDVVSDNYGDPAPLLAALRRREHTAWICDEQRSCKELIYCAHQLNLRIPEDISLVTLAPASPCFLFPMDVTRFCPDNKARTAKAMELINAPENLCHQLEIVFEKRYHKGVTVKKMSPSLSGETTQRRKKTEFTPARTGADLSARPAITAQTRSTEAI